MAIALGDAVGLELGRRRSLGLRTVALRPLGPHPGASAETARWAWVPGAAPAAHPVYTPAAVNFLGTAGIGLSCPTRSAPP